MLELKPTRFEYHLADESGYEYTIVATYNPERGWSATVSLDTHGFKTEHGAIQHLRSAAEHLARQLRETYGDKPH